MKIIEETELKPEPKVDISLWPILDLPSKFKCYPTGTKLFGRPLTVPEVEKLGAINESNYNFVIKQVLSSATQGINVDDMLVADKLYVVFWLRANTYREPGYYISFTCNNVVGEGEKAPVCKKDGKYDFSLDQLKISYVPDNFDSVKNTKVRDIEISYCTNKEFDEMVELKKDEEIVIKVLDLAANVKIPGKNSLVEKYTFLKGLTPPEYCRVQAYVEKYSIGINPIVSIPCKECGGMAQVGISFQRDFFVPEYTIE